MAKITPQQLHSLVETNLPEVTQALLNVISRGARQAGFVKGVSLLSELQLLEGLTPAKNKKPPFFARMTDSANEKRDLAAYCLDKCGLHGLVDDYAAEMTRRPEEIHNRRDYERVFLESGSTIAYVIGKLANTLAQAIQGVPDARFARSPNLLRNPVLTNNLLALTALAGLADDVQPIQGRLDAKYFGFFPFFDVEPNDPTSRGEEIRQFERLRDQTSKCNRILATCSNFSLLAGPLVGSRANALVKRAIHSGTERWCADDKNACFVLFHFNKLVPLFAPIAEPAIVDMRTPTDACYRVFGGPSSDTRLAAAQFPQRASLSKWHAGWLGIDPTVSFGQCALDQFEEPGIKARFGNLPGLLRSWLDVAIDTHVIVALPHTNRAGAFDVLADDKTNVNRILQEAQVGTRYRFLDDVDIATAKGNALGSGVAHLVYKRDSGAS